MIGIIILKLTYIWKRLILKSIWSVYEEWYTLLNKLIRTQVVRKTIIILNKNPFLSFLTPSSVAFCGNCLNSMHLTLCH